MYFWHPETPRVLIEAIRIVCNMKSETGNHKIKTWREWSPDNLESLLTLEWVARVGEPSAAGQLSQARPPWYIAFAPPDRLGADALHGWKLRHQSGRDLAVGGTGSRGGTCLRGPANNLSGFTTDQDDRPPLAAIKFNHFRSRSKAKI
jgi:hypothetical protein